MTTYDNNLTGIISKNDRKTDDKHPDIKGQCEISGVNYWIDGWAKSRKSDGGKFYSLRFKAKDGQDTKQHERPSHDAAKARQTASGGSGFDDMDGDLPPF